LQICKHSTFEFAHVVFSSSEHSYFVISDESFGVVSKIATPVFLCQRRCAMTHGIHVVFSSARHSDFADGSVVQINTPFTSQTSIIGVEIISFQNLIVAEFHT
jgi:hypothetical protein